MVRTRASRRRRRALVCLACTALLVFVLPRGASAQSGNCCVTWGVKVGVSVAAPLTSVVSGARDSRTDFMGGGFVTVPIRRPFAIQPEVLYTTKGWKYTTGEVTQALKITYLAVPVLARLSFRGTVSPYVVAGPQIAFRVKSAATLEGPGISTPVTMFPASTRTAIDIVVGGGIEVRRLLVEGRYTRGLSDTIGPVPTVPGQAKVEQKYRVLSLLAGVRF